MAKKILLVEDELVSASLFSHILKRAGYQVIGPCPSGEEAVAAARKTRPDAALMDYQLSGVMTGVEVAERVRKKRDIPIIFITSHDDEATTDRIRKTAPYGYLSKPIRTRELLVTLELALVKHRSGQEIQILNEKLHALTARIEEVRENEKALLAREIHDEFGQILTAMKFDLAWLETYLKKEPEKEPEMEPRRQREAARKRVHDLIDILQQAVNDVRRISNELRPAMLNELGLVPTMQWYLRNFEERTGIKASFETNVQEVLLKPRPTVNLFRIFQETLTNVARHSGAKKVNIRLAAGKKNLELSIEDDGRGIKKSEIQSASSLGIIGMNERAYDLKGELTLRGKTGKGTVIWVKIPK